MEQRRLQYVNLAKVCGLFLVLLSHSMLSGLSVLLYFGNIVLIPIFFVCAGYTTTRDFSLKKKAKKLLVPYFVINFFLLVIFCKNISWLNVAGVFYSRFSLFPIDAVPDADNLFFFGFHNPPYNSPLWFLTAMTVAYILYRPLFRLKGRKAAVLATAYAAISYLSSFLPVLLPWSIDTAFMLAVFMYLGACLRRWNILERKIWIAPCLIAYLAVIVCKIPINLSVRIFGDDLWQYILVIVGAVSGSCLLLMFLKIFEKFNLPFLNFLSANALIIFAVQMPILEGVGLWCRSLSFYPEITALTQIASAFVLGGAVSYAYGRISRWLSSLHFNCLPDS